MVTSPEPHGFQNLTQRRSRPFPPGPPGAPDGAVPSSPRPIRGAAIPPACWSAAGWTPPPCAARKTPLSMSCSPARWPGRAPAGGALPPRLPGRQSQHGRAGCRHVRRRLWACRWMRPARAWRPGLGVIPRIVRDGAEIYRGKLDSRRSRRAAQRIVQALSPGAGRLDGGNPRPLRRGGVDRLPFHAVGAVGARYRAGRPLWRVRRRRN